MEQRSQLRRWGSVWRVLGYSALLGGLLGGGASRAHAQIVFLDVISVTPGTAGSGAFTGTLAGVSVTGAIAAGVPSFSFNATGTGINSSTIDLSSPQYSYSTVYAPVVSLTDRIGWSSLGLATNVVTIAFGSPVIDPVFHVANLDLAQFSFASTSGLTSMTLLKGNDGSGDGIDPVGIGTKLIQDANPGTSDATLPGISPPTSGARSSYGSVRLNGTISTIVIGMGTNGPGSDVGGGSFTISVPEPGSLILVGFGGLGLAGFGRRRPRKTFALA